MDHAPRDNEIDENGFVDRLKIARSAETNFKDGAEATYGDTDEAVAASTDGKGTASLVLLAKPKPSYTMSARESGVRGTVVLKVTFLKNDGVGPISIVKGLPSGLTEKAIAAARRIVFLPPAVDGKTFPVAKMVEFRFSNH